MPYPSEHACRVKDPDSFEKDSFRRMKSGKVDLIIGKLKGAESTTLQAIRYPKSSWSESEARADCEKHKGSFEAASKSTQEMDYLNPLDNPLISVPEDDGLTKEYKDALEKEKSK
jgi:hypothetical protein